MILREEFEVHNSLNPKLWDTDNKLHADVREKILEIVDQFKLTCDSISINIVDIFIVGSNASYNYTKYSDLDVHIVTNFELFDSSKELLQSLFNALKAKFKSDYDITIRDIDVELYVEDIRSTAVSNGVYSVLTNTWIKFPKKLDDIPQYDISDSVAEWKQKFESAISSEDSDVIQDTINELYLIRRTSLDLYGEYSKGNQLFKEIRNLGLLDSAKNAYKNFRSKELTLEHLRLTEDSRTHLLTKSKQSRKGMQRFKRRVRSRVSHSVKQYNSIDMNKLFKEDILTVDVDVQGETDKYTVRISFGGFLEILQDQVKSSNTFNLKSVTRALITGFNRDDVYIHCSCPDAQYRFGYWQTRNNINSGNPENRPSNITNPDDNLGSACKHVLLVLSNTSWLLKVASVIYNYVNYIEKHYERLYQKVIYPKIWNREYEQDQQLTLFDDEDELSSDKETIDSSNKEASTKNQFKPGNEYRFQPKSQYHQLDFDEITDADDTSNNTSIDDSYQ